MTKTGSLSDELFKRMRTDILSGGMEPGTRMSAQKKIAEAEDVSRTVVREAVKKLEAEGLLVSRQGSGVFVAKNARYRAFQVTPDELTELADVVRLLEMRLAIETEMAAFAAARRTTEHMEAMWAALREIDRVEDDPQAAAAADARFHITIGKATNNDYYVRLIDFLGVRLVPPRNLYLRDRPLSEHRAYADQVRAEHMAIMDAIVRMDIDEARNAARAHMRESLTRHSKLSERIASARLEA